MGLFREHFHWKTLATWPIGAISILLAIAAALRVGGQYIAAAGVCVLATFAMLVRIIHAAATYEGSRANRISFSVVCSIVVMAIATYVVAVTRPAPPEEPPTSVTGPSGPPPESPPKEETPTPMETPKPTSPEAPKDTPTLTPTKPHRLFVDCRLGTMPAKVPESGRVYALVPQEFPEENGGGGL